MVPLIEYLSLAAKVEDCCCCLHYRLVTVLKDDGLSRVVQMECVRAFGPIPWRCRWAARQRIVREDWRIVFEHLAGPARGMAVEWRLEPNDDGVHAAISHKLKHPLGRVYSDFIVGPLFVSAIAGQTLQALKSLVEKEAAI